MTELEKIRMYYDSELKSRYMPEFDRLTSYQHNDIKNSFCYQWWCFHVEVENFGIIIEKIIKGFLSFAAKILK